MFYPSYSIIYYLQSLIDDIWLMGPTDGSRSRLLCGGKRIGISTSTEFELNVSPFFLLCVRPLLIRILRLKRMTRSLSLKDFHVCKCHWSISGFFCAKYSYHHVANIKFQFMFSRRLMAVLRSISPLVILGFGRLIFTTGVDYQVEIFLFPLS